MNFRIDTEGLSLKEVLELEKIVSSVNGVESAKFSPFLSGRVERRAFPVVTSTATMHLLIRVAEGFAIGVGTAAGRHLYKKIGETIVDKVWAAVATKLTGKSNVEVSVTLFAPDGSVITKRDGKR